MVAASISLLERLKKGLCSWRAIGFLAVVVALIWLAGRGLPDGKLHVYFLDVGQGDAIFVRTPDGRQILVDGGPSPAALLEELSSVMPFWDRTLDLVVLTHPDQDHQAGLFTVLERYQVGQVVQTKDARLHGSSDIWQARLADAATPVSEPLRNARIIFGSIVLTVLNPGQRPFVGTAADDNNNSLVVRLDYGETGFLLAGDAEEEAEAAILASGLPVRAQVLKVGHHGSSHSSSPSFVAAIAPRLAVIQVGAGNRFGHPGLETLQRLQGARVLRTDQAGRIEVTSDGQRLWVSSEK